MNKYEQWYNDITLRGQSRKLDGYAECHHIIPESIGGPDTTENKTMLTAREHFVCHWLLTKIYVSSKYRHQVLKALWMMRAENPNQERYGTTITSRVYASLKEEYAELQSERMSGENNPMYGDKFYRSEDGKRRQSEAISGENNGSKQSDAREKISQSKLGKSRAPFSEEWKAKLSASSAGENNSRYGVEVSEETRKKIGDKIRGRKQTEEEKRARGLANLGKIKPKKLCPHCQQLIAVNTYPRWHGDRCSAVKKLTPA